MQHARRQRINPPTGYHFFFEEICGNSSVGRARPCQGRGREFESRFPLQILKKPELRSGFFMRVKRLFLSWMGISIGCGRKLPWASPDCVASNKLVPLQILKARSKGLAFFVFGMGGSTTVTVTVGMCSSERLARDESNHIASTAQNYSIGSG